MAAASTLELPQEGDVQLTAGRCHYRIFGSPAADAPLTVLVHGINGGKFLFDELAADFKQHGHAVLTYDLYGRGGSEVTDYPHKVCLRCRGGAAAHLVNMASTESEQFRPICL